MSDRNIDLERVVSDPAYRRRVIDYLNRRDPPAETGTGGSRRTVEAAPLRTAARN